MKKISIRLFSIIAVISILAGVSFIAAPVPAAAGNLSWTTLSSPVVTEGTIANIFDIASDGTIYLYDGSTLHKSVDNGVNWITRGIGTNFNGMDFFKIVVNPDNPNSLIACTTEDLYRSTNGGNSWYPLEFDISGLTGDPVIKDIDIANGEAGDAILVAFTNANVYSGGVALYDSVYGSWKTTWENTLGTSTTWGSEHRTGSLAHFNALAVAFSPDYINDHTIIAAEGNEDCFQLKFLVEKEYNDWNEKIADAVIEGSTSANTIADIAFPSDFSFDTADKSKLFVGIGNSNSIADVYRIECRSQNLSGGAESVVVNTNAEINVSSIDFKGTITNGILAAGAYDEGVIYTASNAGTATLNNFNWMPSTQNPRGGTNPNTLVKFIPAASTLYAGTEGSTLAGTTATATATMVGEAATLIVDSIAVVNPGSGYTSAPIVSFAGGTPDVAATAYATINAIGQVTGIAVTSAGTGYDAAPTITLSAPQGFGYGSALSVSTDYQSFSGIAFVSISDLANIHMPYGSRTNIGQTVQFQKLYDKEVESYLLFKSTDSGATWKFIYEDKVNEFSVYLSPNFDTDNTIYLYQRANAAPPNNLPLKRYIKSTDGGQTWTSNTYVGSVAATAFAPIDGSHYWIGSPAGIRSNTTSTVYLDGIAPLGIIPLDENNILVWGGNGEWWYSTDNGANFTATGAKDTIGMSYKFTLATDGQHYIIFLLDSEYNLRKYTIGVSTEWSIFRNASIFNDVRGSNWDYEIGSISLSPNGIWYVTGIGNIHGQIWRATPDLVSFEAVSGTSPASIGGSIESVPGVMIYKNNSFDVLNTCIATAATVTSYCSTWKTYTDTLSLRPTTKSPSANSTVTSPVDFTWNAVSGAEQYQVQVAYDAEFSLNNVPIDLPTTGTGLYQVSLNPGRQYYWRVRVSEPIASPWSQPVAFTTSGSASTYTLTVNISPSGSGTVALNKQGPYTAGDTVQLTAAPQGGYTFANWSGDATGSTNPVTITMNGNKTVTANFTATTPVTNKLVFTSTTQSVTAGSASGVITIQNQNSSGTPVNVSTDTIISLTSTSAQGSFDTSAAGDFDGTISQVTILTGHNQASFYYKDTLAGASTITANSSSYSSISQAVTVTAAAASQVRVETKADGSGTVVPAQTVYIGKNLTVYSITRDQYGNFVGNPETNWSLTAISGGVLDTDLSAASGASVTFTGHAVGTAVIHAEITDLTSVDSGALTVKKKSSSTGSGGGGGGAPPPAAPSLQVAGLNTASPVTMNTDGTTKAAAQYKTGDGKLSLDITAGTKLTNSTGATLTTLSAAVLANPPAAPEGNAILLAYELGPEGATFTPALTLTFSYGTLPES